MSMMMMRKTISYLPPCIMRITFSYVGDDEDNVDDDNDDDEKDNTFPSPLYNEARWRVY